MSTAPLVLCGTAFHLEGLPPTCFPHGYAYGLSPFSQSAELAEALDRRAHPHEFHGYEGLSHYFVQTADDATTHQMFRDALDRLGGFLPEE